MVVHLVVDGESAGLVEVPGDERHVPPPGSRFVHAERAYRVALVDWAAFARHGPMIVLYLSSTLNA